MGSIVGEDENEFMVDGIGDCVGTVVLSLFSQQQHSASSSSLLFPKIFLLKMLLAMLNALFRESFRLSWSCSSTSSIIGSCLLLLLFPILALTSNGKKQIESNVFFILQKVRAILIKSSIILAIEEKWTKRKRVYVTCDINKTRPHHQSCLYEFSWSKTVSKFQ